ncbi:HK97-gp10 family putative phage morphogenesis protein [Hespellia stercorisuis]|uniref:Phage protein, HK97 gp10 family n=1 Tax=Hespellia stercorisuis DSM 15480 TaxID=1121950 RepID=A0A1M6RGE8_9FIRM|nr:HK97-gp10 family putative phage morphogenesis protein [Hespellia stercorisuis]SHK31490.1 phage protein, HK97 gp10 family [Hespellia stercorisuis DSM 15480]
MGKVEIVGMQQLQKKLKKNVTLDDVKRVVRTNGSQMQTKAQRNAPVDSGTLKRSIGLELSAGGLEVAATPTAEYAPYVELGTRFMDAQPYLKPAFNEQKKKFEQDMQKLVR